MQTNLQKCSLMRPTAAQVNDKAERSMIHLN